MSSDRLEKRIGAYRDGTLSAGKTEKLRQQLEADPDARILLSRHEALGRLTREAWTEGPPAPPADHLIASLRLGMARIDAELEQQRFGPWRRFAFPLAVPAIGMGLAALLVVALMRDTPPPVPESSPPMPAPMAYTAPEAPALPVQTVSTLPEAEAAEPLPVYDLAQGDSPLMIFEDGGTTFIWLIEPDRAREDLSSLPAGSWLGRV